MVREKSMRGDVASKTLVASFFVQLESAHAHNWSLQDVDALRNVRQLEPGRFIQGAILHGSSCEEQGLLLQKWH